MHAKASATLAHVASRLCAGAILVVLSGSLASASRSRAPAGQLEDGVPRLFHVTYCHLAIAVDTTNRRIGGRVTVDLRVTAPDLRSVSLDLSNSMKVDGVLVGGRPVPFTHQEGGLAIDAGGRRGDRLEFAIDFSGRGAGRGMLVDPHAVKR